MFSNIFMSHLNNNHRPQQSWGKVMFLHVSMILFRGGSAPLHAGIHTQPPGTRGRHPPPGTRHTPWGADPPDQATPPPQCMLGRYGQQAGGTHHTGMQSCLSLLFDFGLKILKGEFEYYIHLLHENRVDFWVFFVYSFCVFWMEEYEYDLLVSQEAVLTYFLHVDSVCKEYIMCREIWIYMQGGHTPAKIKFPVFSLSFPCVR